jgi:hypothetical protein
MAKMCTYKFEPNTRSVQEPLANFHYYANVNKRQNTMGFMELYPTSLGEIIGNTKLWLNTACKHELEVAGRLQIRMKDCRPLQT